jgi:CDP-diacylglycerol--glycerol-3-phosphate 3-phosphatidyltransferase
LALSLVQGGLIALDPAASLALLLMPLTLFARMSLNAIDGLLAREHGSATNLGIVLNELGDLASDIVLYLPLALVPGAPGPLLVIAVCLALVSEATGVLAVQISGSRGVEGPMGKSDRAVLFGGLAFTLGLGASTGVWTTILMIVAIGLLVTTVVNRVRGALGRALRGGLPADAREKVPSNALLPRLVKQ